MTDEQQAKSINAILRAIEFIDPEKKRKCKLADALGIKRQNIEKYITAINRVSLERAIQIENVTSGNIKRSELRPDFF